HKVQPLLRSRGDNDLIRVAAHAAGRSDIFRDGPSQREITPGIALAIQRPWGVPQDAPRHTGPQGNRKEIDRGFVAAECPADGMRDPGFNRASRIAARSSLYSQRPNSWPSAGGISERS